MDEPWRLEYQKLKEEQVARLTARDNLLNFNVIALSTLGAIGVTLQSAISVLLFAPWVSAVFGWAYVQHEQKITAIGRYIRRSSFGPNFAWESESKQVALPKLFHQSISLAILILAFAVPCFACPIFWILNAGPQNTSVATVAVLDLLLGGAITLALLTSFGR